MLSDNVDKVVSLFGDQGSIHKLADDWRPLVEYPEVTEYPELLKEAENGNELAELIIGLNDYFRGDDAASFKQAIKTANDEVSQVITDVDELLGTNVRPRRYSKLVDQLGIVSQIWPGKTFGIPNRPGPLSSMLVLGSLGAATGNVAGRVLGRSPLVDRRRAIRNSSLIGGALGMLPGLAYMGMNYAADKPVISGRVMDLPYLPGVKHSYVDPLMFSRPDLIPVERMQQMIWEDPQVAGRLPVSVAAATSALVEGASRQRPRAFPYVTPTEIARMAMGMGAGYTSGMLTGKALGALFGVSDQSQQVLRNTGAAAGIIKTFVPMAFGR
jgi:hypothetical protein